MTLPKKGTRKIVIDGYSYSWIASGNDGWIDLIICSTYEPGQKLLAQFSYLSFYIETDISTNSEIKQGLTIPPSLVKKVIEYGINSGWSPDKKGTDLQLGCLDKKLGFKLS